MKPGKKIQLPAAIGRFVEQQQTIPLDRLCEDASEIRFPYAEYWRRAIACMMLSQRVQPKSDGTPNRTDIIRICKEANFNPYMFEHFGEFLVSADIVNPGKYNSGPYLPGKNLAGFWNHDLAVLEEASRGAFLRLLQKFTGYKIYRPTPAHDSGLDKFVAVLAAAFRGLALKKDEIGNIMRDFDNLPKEALQLACERLDPGGDGVRRMGWSFWLDTKGQEALLAALYACEWAYAAEIHDERWFFFSDIARVLFGLERPPKVDPLPRDFEVLPNLCVFAGAGLPFETLLPLFRWCQIKRIDRIFEFQFDPKRLKDHAPKESPAAQLRAALAPAGKLPQTVEALLAGKPTARGRVQYRACAALLKPENAEVLTAIREHPRLKGYLLASPPPGYLLIKPTSDPINFVVRCRDLGFTVDSL